MLQGDASAFDDFFETAYPALYRFALTRLGFDRDAAGDVAQAAICKAIRKLRTFRGEAALLTWLYTFCRHELYAYRRQHGPISASSWRRTIRRFGRRSSRCSAPSSEDLDASLDRHKIASLVQRALDYLPPHYSNALEWKYVDEMSVREIGGRMGLGAEGRRVAADTRAAGVPGGVPGDRVECARAEPTREDDTVTDKDACGGEVARMEDRLGELIKAAGRREAPDAGAVGTSQGGCPGGMARGDRPKARAEARTLAGAAVLATAMGLSFIALRDCASVGRVPRRSARCSDRGRR